MRSKAARRLNPFLTSPNLSSDDLKKLTPSDIGEITNLLRLREKELQEERTRTRENLLKEGCSQKGIEANLMHINAKIDHCQKVKGIFEKVMAERKEMRYSKA